MGEKTNNKLERLVRQCAAGDETAFRRLYDSTSAPLYALALRMMQSQTGAEDVLQDSFVQVWHRAGDYHADRGGVMTWLSSIVRYRAIDTLRKQRRSRPLDDDAIRTLTDLDDDRAAPVDSAIAADESRDLDDCLSRLSASQRESVALAFFRGLTHHELAQCLATPLGTIKSRLRRSLLRLRQCLAELGYGREIHTGTG